MKKFISLFATLLICVTSFAQSSSEQLTFKGDPIDRTLRAHVAKMKSTKFSHIEPKNKLTSLSGEFAGYERYIMKIKTFKHHLMPEETISIIVTILALIFILWLYIFLPARMARKRGRNTIGWILLFWIISPLWGIIVLFILGDSKQKIRKDIIKELHQD